LRPSASLELTRNIRRSIRAFPFGSIHLPKQFYPQYLTITSAPFAEMPTLTSDSVSTTGKQPQWKLSQEGISLRSSNLSSSYLFL
jgi:hypothetical protein